jgi:hypothetical protein
MSYKIVFKGDIEPAYISDAKGAILAAKWQSDSIRGRIDIDGMLVEAASIKAIIPNASDPNQAERKRRGIEDLERMNGDFRAYRQRRLDLQPRERAQSVAMMNMVSQALRGRPLSEDEIPKVREAQERFFVAHPTFHVASPTCFFTKDELSKAIQQKDADTGSDGVHRARAAFGAWALRFVERNMTA